MFGVSEGRVFPISQPELHQNAEQQLPLAGLPHRPQGAPVGGVSHAVVATFRQKCSEVLLQQALVGMVSGCGMLLSFHKLCSSCLHLLHLQ